MEKSYDVLNYLNLINEKFGLLYLKHNFNPLPLNFRLTEKVIKERLDFETIKNEISAPGFIYDKKKNIYKNFKNSLKNTKKIKKNVILNNNFSLEFKNKLNFYLSLRIALLKIELKNFKKTDFNELDSISEICAINPIFSPCFEATFNENFDLPLFLFNIEKDYYETLKKLNVLIEEKKIGKDRKKIEVNNLINTQKIIDKTQKIKKNKEKAENIKNSTIKNKEIKEKVKSIKNKTQNNIKEKS